MQSDRYQADVTNYVPQPALTTCTRAQCTVTLRRCKGTLQTPMQPTHLPARAKMQGSCFTPAGAEAAQLLQESQGLRSRCFFWSHSSFVRPPHLDGAGVLQTPIALLSPLQSWPESSAPGHTSAETQPPTSSLPSLCEEHALQHSSWPHFCDPREITGLQHTQTSRFTWAFLIHAVHPQWAPSPTASELPHTHYPALSLHLSARESICYINLLLNKAL